MFFQTGGGGEPTPRNLNKHTEHYIYISKVNTRECFNLGYLNGFSTLSDRVWFDIKIY